MLKVSKYCLLSLIASCVLLAQPLMAAAGIKGNLVSVGWLQQNLNNADILIVDASPTPMHRAQHIPGAINVDLFSYGGQELPVSEMEDLLLKVKSDLQIARDYQRAKFEAIVAGLLGTISVLSLDSLISKVVKDLRLPANSVPTAAAESELLGLAVSFGLALIVGIAVYLRKKPEPDRQDD